MRDQESAHHRDMGGRPDQEIGRLLLAKRRDGIRRIKRILQYGDGIDAEEIRALARDIAAGPRTAVYGRMGTSTVRFGTLTSWLVDVVNVLTGNLDRPGGAMFPTSPISAAPRPARPGRGFTTDRWLSPR